MERLVDRIDTDKTLFHGIDNYVNLVLDNYHSTLIPYDN